MKASINMADPFSSEARAVLSQAEVEATRLNHPFICAGHILLAVIATDAELAKVLAVNDVLSERVRDALRTIYTNFAVADDDMALKSQPPLSTQAKAAIERSIEAVHPVHQSGASMIEPAHLLLGILEQPDGVVAGILVSFGVDRKRLIDQVSETVR